MLQLHMQVIDALETAIREVEAAVGKALQPIQDLAQLLTTIPGVSDIVAQVLVSEARRGESSRRAIAASDRATSAHPDVRRAVAQPARRSQDHSGELPGAFAETLRRGRR
jgi:hypothetical protein